MSGSKNTIYGLVSQFLGQQNNISVPVPLVRMLGDYTAAAFVAQVTYWSDRTRDPEGWFWKTYEQWLEEMHLTNDQIRRCVKTANGLVEVKRAGVPARNFYRINRGLLVERLQELADREIVITSRNGETQHLDEDTDFPHGQSLGNPTASAQTNPTSSTKTTSKTSTKKKEVGELPLEVEAAESGRFYEGQEKEQEPHVADLPDQAAPLVEPQAPTPVTVEDWIGEGEGVDDQATDSEEVPAARDEIHELSMWDPQVVNARIDQLFNRRWLKGYRIRGQGPTQPALITEVDGSGVDRATLAGIISPEKLEELVAEVRRERARLEAAARNDSSVRVLTAQHMLIQAMQSWALRLENLKASMSTLRAGAETDEDARPWDDDGHTPVTPTLTLQTPKAGRAWRVGDVVSYRRDRYTIASITDRKIILDSEENGGVDIIRATSEIDALRLIQAAGEAIEGCA